MSTKLIARIISRIFEPLLFLVILLFVALSRSGYSFGATILLFFLMIALILLPPLTLLLLALKLRVISDWDIRIRKERMKALSIFLPLFLVDIPIVHRYASDLLTNMMYVFAIWLIGFTLITLFWKISGHTSVMTLCSLFLFRWYGIIGIVPLLGLPLLIWSRIYLKHHTLAQTLAGIGFSTMIFLGAIWLGFV